MKTDIIVIGAGPAGLFSVFQAGMLGMQCCVLDPLDSVGGQCSALYPEKPIYDIPAYPKILAGDFIENLVEQAAPFNPTYLLARTAISLTKEDTNFVVGTDAGDNIRAKAIIIAAGSGAFGPNRPPLPDIEAYENKSVFYFVAKKNQFADKNIVIAGGGDSALDWAINLADIATKIYVIHRRNKFRALPDTVRKLYEIADTGKIEIITDYALHSLQGDVAQGKLSEVVISNLDGNLRTLPADNLLPFFGLSQDLGPILNFGLGVSGNRVKVNYPYFETDTPGVYAVGDAAFYPGKLKLILTGFAESAAALHHAYERVFDGKVLHFEYSTTKGVKTAE